MKKKNLMLKLEFSKETISKLSKIKGGDMDLQTRSCDDGCGGGGGGGRTNKPNAFYTHRPCDTQPYNLHCIPYYNC